MTVPGWLRGPLFAVAALVVAVFAFVATVPLVPRLFPYLATLDTSGFSADRQLAYG